MRRSGWLAMSWVMLSGVLGAHACGGRTDQLTSVNNDSESHFLASCHAGGCAEGLSCVLGVCTQTCVADAECTVWSPSAGCRPEPTSGGSATCDVECDTQTECAGLGAAFDCTNGVCRAPDAGAAGEFFRACSDDSCSEGLSCISGQCTKPCRRDADCGFPGASCDEYYDDERTVTAFHCVMPCEGAPGASAECALLGSGGRCLDSRCQEVFGGQCGDLGSPGGEWACYDDIAADVFRERHAGLLDDEVCLPARDTQVYDIDYRLCGDSTCADGASGCAVPGLVLETQPMAEADVARAIDTSLVRPLVAATGEVRLREPMNVRIELLDPVERCEYSVGLRWWGVQLLDHYNYVSANDAAVLASYPETREGISADAVQSGLWQAIHDVTFLHVEAQGQGIIIEDSEADIVLLSGGERCTALQSQIGVRVRSDLVNVVNRLLNTWARGVEDTLACRYR